MRRNKDRELFLEQLKKVPIIMYACEKTSIARSTVYRWREQSKKFAKDMEKAIEEGEALINEMGESQLISLIRDKNFPAVRFWLTHRNPKFRERVEVTTNLQGQEELSKEQKTVVREALRLASLGKKTKK